LAGPLDSFIETLTIARKERIRRPIEATLEKAMAKAFATQGAKLLGKLSEAHVQEAYGLCEAGFDWEKAFDATANQTLADFVDPIVNAVEASIQAATDATVTDLKLDTSFDLKNPRAVKYIESRGAENVKGINATTKDSLKSLIAKAVEDSKSYTEITTLIRKAFADFSLYRARLIAVTEVGNGYEAGNRMLIDALIGGGLAMEKSWLTVGDANVDPECADNEAQGWIPVDQVFGSGHDQPLAHPNCRCTCLYRQKGSEN
jgi:hypothetical protein